MSFSGRRGLPRAGLCLLAALFLSGCVLTETSPFVTSYTSTLAEEVSGTPKLCIVSFSVDELLYDSSGGEQNPLPGPLDVSLARREARRTEAQRIATVLATAHLEHTVPRLAPTFEVVGDAGPHIVAFQPISDTVQLAHAIAGCGADLGLVVHDRYGWDWDAENTGPQSYYFRSCASLLNAQGQAVWSFCSKGTAGEVPKLSLKTLMAGAAGVPPPVEEMLHQYQRTFEYLPQIWLALIEEDVLGTPHGSMQQYVKDEEDARRLLIENSGDRRRVPSW